MSREASPAFQFYPKDFLADEKVMALSLTERGAYITLLCICWLEGSIPADPQALAKILRLRTLIAPHVIRNVTQLFTKNEHSRMTHLRLDREREKQKTFRKLREEAGRRGGRAKAMLQPTQVLLVAKRSSSSSSATTYNPPTPLQKGGGRITRKEREHAQAVRARVYGRCPHEPRCPNYDACIEVIARTRQQKQRGRDA